MPFVCAVEIPQPLPASIPAALPAGAQKMSDDPGSTMIKRPRRYATCEAAATVENSSPSEHHMSKRHKSAHPMSVSLPCHRVSASPTDVQHLSSQTGIAQPDVYKRTSRHHRIPSFESEEFPDVDTLFTTCNDERESRRQMPVRAKNILPTIERSPSFRLRSKAQTWSGIVPDSDPKRIESSSVQGQSPQASIMNMSSSSTANLPHGNIGTTPLRRAHQFSSPTIPSKTRTHNGLPQSIIEHKQTMETPRIIKDEYHGDHFDGVSSNSKQMSMQQQRPPLMALGPQLLTPTTQRHVLKADGLVEQEKADYSLRLFESANRQLKMIEKLVKELKASKEECTGHDKLKKKHHGVMKKKARNAEGMTHEGSGGSIHKRDGPRAFPVSAVRGQPAAEQWTSTQRLQDSSNIDSAKANEAMDKQAKAIAESSPELANGDARASGDPSGPIKHGRKSQGTGKSTELPSSKRREKLPDAQGQSRHTEGPSGVSVSFRTERYPVVQTASVSQNSTEGPSTPQTVPVITGESRGERIRHPKGNSDVGGIRKSSRPISQQSMTHPFARQEVPLQKKTWICICDHLHPYFQKPKGFRPTFSEFPGCKAEFHVHARQIIDYPAHALELKSHCRRILAEYGQDVPVSSTGMIA